jgi:O-antigen/teichoic acid export membrane protein
VAIAQLDVLVLALVASAAEVGRYAAVSRLLLGGAYLPMLAGDVILPTATALFANEARVAWQARRIEEAVGLTALAAALAGLAVVAGAGLVIGLVYGTGFAPLAVLLRLGSLYVVLKIVNVAVQTTLTVVDHQRGRAASVGAALAVTASLIVMLGSQNGAYGAVVALAAGEAAGLVVAVAWMRDLYSPAAATRALLVAASGTAVALWISVGAAGSVALAAVAGLAVTSAASFGQRFALADAIHRIRGFHQAPSADDEQ